MSDATQDPTALLVKLTGEVVALRETVKRLAAAPDPAVAATRAVEATLSGNLRPAVDALHQRERSLREAENECRRRTQQAEAEVVAWRRRLCWAAGGGAGAALVLVALLLRVVPDGLSDRLYAALTGQSRISAAAEMIRRADPDFYNDVAAANALMQRAGTDVDKCLKAAEKAGKAVRCTLQLQPPRVAQKD